MIETATTPALRTIATEAHRQRSLIAWAMIGAIARLPARLLALHEKWAAQPDGPSRIRSCTA